MGKSCASRVQVNIVTPKPIYYGEHQSLQFKKASSLRCSLKPTQSSLKSTNASLVQVIYKSWASHVQVMCKSWASHIQVMYKLCASHEQFIFKSCSSHVQVLCKSCASHVQIMGKSWASHVEVVCKWTLLFVDLNELFVGFSEHPNEEAFLNCRLWCSP